MTTPGENPSRGGRSTRWFALVQQSTEPMFVLNGRGRLIFVNTAWETLTGLPASEVRGQFCRPRRGDSRLSGLAPPSQVFEGGIVQTRRRWRERIWDVAYFPWKKEGAISVILGKMTLVPNPSTTSRPLPDSLLHLRVQRALGEGWEIGPGSSPRTRLLQDQIRLALGSTSPVLIEGPRGIGKEWAARAIHFQSARREEPFAALDAQLLPPSFWEPLNFQSFGGVYVRNAQTLSPEWQRRLLESWQDQDEPQPRWYFGCLDSDQALQTKAWSAGFYFHLRTLHIRLDPLAQRREELAFWVQRLLPRAAEAAGRSLLPVAKDALDLFELYDWPGNFTELIDTLRNAFMRARGNRIEPEDVPLHLRQSAVSAEKPLDLDVVLETVERRLIEQALQKAGNNKSKAAEMLGVWRARLLRRMEQLKIGGKVEEDPEPKDV